MQKTLLILAVLVVVAWLWLRRRARQEPEPQEASAAPRKIADTTYHAVSIKFAKEACTAAKALTGERFLATEAPRLPLPGCDAERCECRFTHHADRRSGKDRRSPFGRGAIGGGTGRFDKERRDKPDRRRSTDTDSL